MKEYLLAFYTIIALTACNDSSKDVVDKPQEQVTTFETTNVQLQFNLPASSHVLNTEKISLDDPISYNASVSTTICTPSGQQVILHVFFIKTAPQKWDVYYRLDDELLDIENGKLGGTGQYKATLEFDETGNFIRQVPYILNSTELQYPEKNYRIEFDFYSHLTTHFDESFTVKKIRGNGC